MNFFDKKSQFISLQIIARFEQRQDSRAIDIQREEQDFIIKK